VITSSEAPQAFFDGSFLTNKSGIGRDSRNFLKAATNVYGANLRVIYPRLNWNLKFGLSDDPVSSANRKFSNLFSYIFGQRFLQLDQNAIYLQSHLYGPIAKGSGLISIIRVHDVFPITNSDWFRKISVKLFSTFFNQIPKDTTLLCNSKFTHDQVLTLRSDFTDLRIAYCPVGIPVSEICNTCQLCRTFDAHQSQYFITIGTVEPRKNYRRLLELWEESKRSGNNSDRLIILGKRGWKSKKIASNINKSLSCGIEWYENSCDASLFNALKNSLGLISISRSEGFNLPVAEARILRKPIALSKAEVHKEIFARDAIFIDTESQKSFDSALKMIKQKDVPIQSNELVYEFSTAIKKMEDILKSFIQ